MKKVFIIILIVLSFSFPCYAKEDCILNFYGIEIESFLYDEIDYGIIVPKNLNTEKQLITIEQIKSEMNNLPTEFIKNINYIILLDFEYKKDKETNIKTFASYTGGTISFYCNNEYDGKKEIVNESEDSGQIFSMETYIQHEDIKDRFRKILIHEIAHSIDINYSNDETWKNIVDKDDNMLYFYNKNVFNVLYDEEFAESVAYILTDWKYFKDNYSDRYQYIKNVLKEYGFKFNSIIKDQELIMELF